MIVYAANNSGSEFMRLADEYGNIGHLYSPRGQRGPYPGIPYALDNGAFSYYLRGEKFNGGPYINLLRWAKNAAGGQAPDWALVPDAVGDRDETLRMWQRWRQVVVRGCHFLAAFAVQDGMTKNDVPKSAAVIFVGGSKDWKWDTVQMWVDEFPRVHVGRVSSYPKLELCASIGVESVDGTGWFRDPSRTHDLEVFLAKQNDGGIATRRIAKQKRLDDPSA